MNEPFSGCVTERSCLTNVLCFVEEITKCVDDESPPVDVICLDFQKAFDNAPQLRLIISS